ncbi:MAG TPA: ATP-binding protein [Thermoanaerobaculia bacterium]|nr:ATP-binding protein [Thermoanaerobaculia bacterium]
MTPPLRERRSMFRVASDRTLTTVVPVAFIIVSLLSLLVLPLAVSRHTARMRHEITRIAEPARQSANQIQIDLASELDRIIAFQVTGQSQYQRAYIGLLAQQEKSRRDIAALVPHLGTDISEDLTEVSVRTEAWHKAVRDQEFVSRHLPNEVFLTRLFEQHPTYERCLQAASELELSMQRAIEDRLQRIRSVERLNTSLTIILTLLALTSAMLVAGLGRQMRLLAGEATRRRHEAEREATDAKTARASAERGERRAAFLASAGQALTSSLDFEQTVNTLARVIVPNLAECCVIDIVDPEGGLRRAAVSHRNPKMEQDLEPQRGRLFPELPDAIVRIMQSQEPHLVGAGSFTSGYFAQSGSNPLMVVPLVSRGRTLGIIAASPAESRPFTAEDTGIFADLARHGALSIDSALLYLESQQAVRAREEVLAIVSHDLRNPLNAITLGTSLLQMSDSVTADEREQLETIAVSARRMERLIADLLDVTRLEGGKQLPIVPERLDVGSILREAYELFRAQSAAASVTLKVYAEEALPPVYADRHRVMQVVSNLIGNALKFTPPGGIISCRAETDGDSILFTVSDTGPGIPKEHQRDIFNPYWQAKRAERLGAGLGLPIAKGVVEAHGGRIWVDSKPGEGARFYFTLPIMKMVEAGEVVSG